MDNLAQFYGRDYTSCVSAFLLGNLPSISAVFLTLGDCLVKGCPMVVPYLSVLKLL